MSVIRKHSILSGMVQGETVAFSKKLLTNIFCLMSCCCNCVALIQMVFECLFIYMLVTKRSHLTFNGDNLCMME